MTGGDDQDVDDMMRAKVTQGRASALQAGPPDDRRWKRRHRSA
jgi:hypothetical protein